MSTDQTSLEPAESPSSDKSSDSQNAPIVARAGSYYRNARYIMFGIIVAMGLWFLYDGLITYPRSNALYDDLTKKIEVLSREQKQETPEYQSLVFKRKETKFHDEFSIRLQCLLGALLPPIGIGLLVFWLRRSRGEIRLENGVLSAPGFPPIPLSKVDELDRQFWEKKGIVYAYYDLGNANAGKIRLDDFIYQAQPIRDIVKEIERELKTQQKTPASTPA
jgi:hypothetical protein